MYLQGKATYTRSLQGSVLRFALALCSVRLHLKLSLLASDAVTFKLSINELIIFLKSSAKKTKKDKKEKATAKIALAALLQ